MTSEDVVLMFRTQPEREELVRNAYWDEDVLAAAERFWHGEEYGAVRELMARRCPARPLQVLDLGAGRGVSSYAFARDGHRVVAVEPDPSEVIGRGAFLELAERCALPMHCVDAVGEQLPPELREFDLVYTRQVLHHATDLPQMLREMFRLLRPGGWLLATREHVLNRREDLPAFLESHATHHLVPNEHAYTLAEYLEAGRHAGFVVRRVLGPWSSAINRFPLSLEAFRQAFEQTLARRVGRLAAARLSRSGALLHLYARWLDARDQTPGRMFSFLMQRPSAGAAK